MHTVKSITISLLLGAMTLNELAATNSNLFKLEEDKLIINPLADQKPSTDKDQFFMTDDKFIPVPEVAGLNSKDSDLYNSQKAEEKIRKDTKVDYNAGDKEQVLANRKQIWDVMKQIQQDEPVDLEPIADESEDDEVDMKIDNHLVPKNHTSMSGRHASI